MANKETVFTLDDGDRYTFYIAHTRGGIEVLAATWDNGTTSDTIWTTDSTIVPEDIEDAQYAIDNYDWAINQSRELLENMKHFNLYWTRDAADMVDFLNNGKVGGWLSASLVVIDDNDNDGTAVYIDTSIDGDFVDLAEQYRLEWEGEI